MNKEGCQNGGMLKLCRQNESKGKANALKIIVSRIKSVNIITIKVLCGSVCFLSEEI